VGVKGNAATPTVACGEKTMPARCVDANLRRGLGTQHWMLCGHENVRGESCLSLGKVGERAAVITGVRRPQTTAALTGEPGDLGRKRACYSPANSIIVSSSSPNCLGGLSPLGYLQQGHAKPKVGHHGIVARCIQLQQRTQRATHFGQQERGDSTS
jgi:hypothetical protein